MGRHQLDRMTHDSEDSWEDVVQYSDPGYFIRYIDPLGLEYEIVD